MKRDEKIASRYAQAAMVALAAECALLAAAALAPITADAALRSIFDAIGLTDRNVLLNSGIFPFLYVNPQPGYACIADIFMAAIALVATVLIRKTGGKGAFSAKDSGIALGVGIIVPAVLIWMFVRMDMLRYAGKGHLPAFHLETWIAALLMAVAIFSEEALLRGAVRRFAFSRLPMWPAVAMMTGLDAMFAFIGGARGMQAVNIPLMTVLLLLAAERLGSWLPGALFRFGWNFAVLCVFGMPGGVVQGLRAAYETYPVSENWLTGGMQSLIGGAGATAVLLGMILCFRPWRATERKG